MECMREGVVGTAKQESVLCVVVCWGVFWDDNSNVGTVDDFIHGPGFRATLDDIASHIPHISTIPPLHPHTLHGASKRGDYLNDNRLRSHRHDAESRGEQAYCLCRVTIQRSLGGPWKSIMIGIQIRQAETQKLMRLEHKALDRKASKPDNASQCITLPLATFITPSYHITSAGGALYRAIQESRDFRFLDVTWLGGVLDLPRDLKRLAVRYRYLAQRRPSHILPVHVTFPGVTLSANC
ncbi:hypothetical protein PTTW11_00099 [Pyrenophora teres f. teres]|uniref:Uncharacterized protein n=1 Tax=Pyrenophora teres f. teres TaxID=97479 RepID=A0A6S6VPA5_9PLEO|nr:hypothetical protein PTTW11_00099 [Pyrenophora teres f. teres]